nr:GNAT family protein [Phytoactinopolyspora alkaliphila]
MTGERIRLVPLGPRHVDATFEALQDPEGLRLTGTHQTFTYEQIERWCASREEQPDRLDMVIELNDTGAYAGELSVNEFDLDNESAGFRIALVSGFQGQGIGPEATRLILGYVFDVVGLHRVQLEVFSFNERARRSYEKCGFVVEGRLRDALFWHGERHDTIVMGILRSEFSSLHG